MDWLEKFFAYLGNQFCFWFSPSRQLSHMKTSFQLRRWRPQSIILIFSLWSTAPPSSARRMGTTAPVLWSLFAQNRRQLSAIIVRKLPAQICNYWPLIVIKFTTNAQRLTPFDKKTGFAELLLQEHAQKFWMPFVSCWENYRIDICLHLVNLFLEPFSIYQAVCK